MDNFEVIKATEDVQSKDGGFSSTFLRKIIRVTPDNKESC